MQLNIIEILCILLSYVNLVFCTVLTKRTGSQFYDNILKRSLKLGDKALDFSKNIASFSPKL